jgi:HEPN domain-containing protein
MCHLSIEKALKGLYCKKFQKNPPKTHDLIYLSTKINLKLPEELQIFLNTLNDLSVPTRYPDEIEKMLEQYDKFRVQNIFVKGKDLLSWLSKK